MTVPPYIGVGTARSRFSHIWLGANGDGKVETGSEWPGSILVLTSTQVLRTGNVRFGYHQRHLSIVMLLPHPAAIPEPSQFLPPAPCLHKGAISSSLSSQPCYSCVKPLPLSPPPPQNAPKVWHWMAHCPLCIRRN